ncbi:hypothetical protein PoB_005709300 [Plakobranchus ocellatus]|uniref:Uncharacterized protein n=1 Tax=Plakobranchus ocellatus TaxID=259542 RepID=A0AAV4CGF7_9GAST|nr:hypothetical protein PoB_005709300 [Plakobranchus ocellatus]
MFTDSISWAMVGASLQEMALRIPRPEPPISWSSMIHIGNLLLRCQAGQQPVPRRDRRFQSWLDGVVYPEETLCATLVKWIPDMKGSDRTVFNFKQAAVH